MSATFSPPDVVGFTLKGKRQKPVTKICLILRVSSGSLGMSWPSQTREGVRGRPNAGEFSDNGEYRPDG